MKLKGWRKLEKNIGKLVNQIDNTIVFELGGEDKSIISQNKVFFSILRSTTADNSFGVNLVESFDNVPNRSVYLYSLLHEIGHIKTKEIFFQEDSQLRQSAESSGNHALYFALPSEKAATQWAIDFAKDNYGFTLTMDRKLVKYVRQFVEKNAG